MSESQATDSFAALGTTAVVAVTDRTVLEGASRLLAADLAEIDRACSRFRSDSELTLVNAHAGVEVTISGLLAQAIQIALGAARLSAGRVDPTLGAQLRAAGYDRTFALVRERDAWQVRAAPCRAEWESVRLDPEARTLFVPEGVELDLGATAKAWAADRSAQRIASTFETGALVSLGGDIAVAGPAPVGGWPVRIADDHAAPLTGPGPVVAVASGGLATSGTAVRRWRTDRGDAHHILDPNSGEPARSPWRLVTVAAATCVDANVASTSAIVLGASAPEWIAARELPARLVRTDGFVVTVSGWPPEALAA